MQLRKLILLLIIGALAGLGVYLYRTMRSSGERGQYVWAFLGDPQSQAGLVMKAGITCRGAPFTFPSNGLVGFIWDDSFRPGHRHQGIDIFAGTDVGLTPVYAAYSGYLTRQSDWKSSVIVRIPNDPLSPGRQIWTYYTHMADANGKSYIVEAFPPGTLEVYIETGTLLGYQGNYSGDPANPVGVHLHFSVVKDNGSGQFLNELDINNTFDPSPYLGLRLNAHSNSSEIPFCVGE
jgi:murein DD-endopeptidase MepM/ murein hydrolase activator NlpD